MDAELRTFDMEHAPLAYGNVYVNVPGTNSLIFYDNLIIIVEKMGEKYGAGKGSNLKKGVRYLCKKTGCTSKRQIKMMLRNVPHAVLRERNDTCYVFRCSKEYYSEVLKVIIKFARNELIKNIDEIKPSVIVKQTYAEVKSVRSQNKDVKELFNKLSYINGHMENVIMGMEDIIMGAEYA